MSHPAGRVPSHIGRFVVDSVLGSGGMGSVYKATDPTLKRLVAIKTVRPDLSEPSFLQRLVGEAQACARLHHPHIVTVYEAGEMEGGAYVVMEYLEGEDLAQALWRGELPFGTRVRMLIQVLDALEHAHANGVVHRDIKPANIRVLPNGDIKIVDFGLARMSQVDARTVTGTILGTLHYASPEQLRGEKVDGRSDIYSTGTMAYEMFSGRKPFDGETVSTIIIKVIQDPVPPMDAQWSRAFPEIESIVRRAMAKNAADRYQSSAEMRNALTAFLSNSGPSLASSMAEATIVLPQPRDAAPAATVSLASPAASQTIAPPSSAPAAAQMPAQPPPATRPWLMPAAAVLALSVLGGASYVMMSNPPPVSESAAVASATPTAPPPTTPADTTSGAAPVNPASSAADAANPGPKPGNPGVPPPKAQSAAPPLTQGSAAVTNGAAVASAVPPSSREMFYSGTSTDGLHTGLRYRVTQQSPQGIEADVDVATATFHAGDKVRLSFESNVDGYLYVVQQGSSGRWSVLFPSPDINFGRNSVRRSEEYKVPEDGWFEFDSNPGVENLFVFFSREPMQTLPGFGKPVTKPETLTASAVTSLQNTIASRDLTFSRDSKATVKAGNTIQASYVVNKSEFGKAVAASIALRHEP